MRDGGVLGFNSHYSYVFDTQWADLLAQINTIEDKTDIIQRLNRSCPGAGSQMWRQPFKFKWQT